MGGSHTAGDTPDDSACEVTSVSDGLSRRNVVLTGFMGTGKTTVGRLLAEALNYAFVDTDALIEERHGPITEIFRDQGEVAFRSFEHEVAEELGATEGLVVSTGGRLMLDPLNAGPLSRCGDVFCLTASIETILERVLADKAVNDRPLLTGSAVRERIEDLLAERATSYAQFDPIATDDREPRAIVGEILDRLGWGSSTDHAHPQL